MSRAWSRSLAGRMFLLLALALVLAQAASFAIYYLDRRNMMQAITEQVLVTRIPPAVRALRELSPGGQQDLIEAISSRWSRYAITAEPPVAPQSHPLAARLAESIGVSADDVSVAIVDPARSRYLTGEDANGFAQVLQIGVHIGDGRWLYTERPQRPSFWLHADRMLISLLLSIAAVLLAAAFIARRIARPLAALSTAADRFGRGEFSDKLEPRGPEDVARTIRAFNLMSERLQRFVSDRTQMLAAISHDLRTPITALRIRAEMIDDDDLRERMIRSLAEMETMVESTLQFARAESAAEPTQRIDLRDLVERAARDVDPPGETIVFRPAAHELAVSCRPIALTRAVRNVLENAVRYGERAEISLLAEPTQNTIVIRDRGPGIPEADQERVFEPFVRLEDSRNTETGGSGLGLAIARTIVRAHGGDIRLTNSEQGLEATITLPAPA